MNEKTKTTIGLFLAIIAIIISFIVPEIRIFLGLDKDINNETKRVEISNETEKNDPEITRELEITPQKENLPSSKKEVKNKEEKEPKIIPKKEEKKQAYKKFNILDEESGKRDFKFENFFKAISNDLGYNQIIIEGSKSINVSPNQSVPSQLRVSIDLNVSIDDKPLTLPTIYGRGDTEKEAINHALMMNKENITNKIKLLK